MFLELGEFRQKMGTITWPSIARWLAERDECNLYPSLQALSNDFKELHQAFRHSVKNKNRESLF